MKHQPIHSDTLAYANRVANRAARSFPQATRETVLAIRDEVLGRLQDRLEVKSGWRLA